MLPRDQGNEDAPAVPSAAAPLSGQQFDTEEAQLLAEVARKMGTNDPHTALRQSLATILALYEAKDEGAQPVVRYKGGVLRRDYELDINLPATSRTTS